MTERSRLALTALGLAASQDRSDYQKADATVVVDCFYVSLYRFALCLTASHSKAADLVRQTFLNFRRSRHQTQDCSTIERCLFTILHRCYLSPNSDFRNLPFGPKPVPRMLSGHVFGVKPRRLRKNKFVPPQVETRPRLTRQIPKLLEATSESELKICNRRNRLQAESVRETRDPIVTEPERLSLPGEHSLPAALAQVNEACRATLSLFYLGNFSVCAIAHILELPIDTVMSNLSKGREQLRSVLSG